MAITREKKAELLKKLKDIVAGATSIAFVHFKGLAVSEASGLRAALKKEGVHYLVTKKTLLKRALSEAKVEGDLPELGGEVAFAYLPGEAGDDITAPARNLNDFVKQFKGRLVFLGGVVENRFLSKAEIEAVAAIPPMPVLRGMFVNIINSPIQRCAIALQAIADKKA